MRYSVEFQTTSGEWVLFDTVAFYMLPNRFKTEEEAHAESLELDEKDRRRVLGSKPEDYGCDEGISLDYPESARTLFC